LTCFVLLFSRNDVIFLQKKTHTKFYQIPKSATAVQQAQKLCLKMRAKMSALQNCLKKYVRCPLWHNISSKSKCENAFKITCKNASVKCVQKCVCQSSFKIVFKTWCKMHGTFVANMRRDTYLKVLMQTT
jgi:hypothetical protein